MFAVLIFTAYTFCIALGGFGREDGSIWYEAVFRKKVIERLRGEWHDIHVGFWKLERISDLLPTDYNEIRIVHGAGASALSQFLDIVLLKREIDGVSGLPDILSVVDVGFEIGFLSVAGASRQRVVEDLVQGHDGFHAGLVAEVNSHEASTGDLRYSRIASLDPPICDTAYFPQEKCDDLLQWNILPFQPLQETAVLTAITMTELEKHAQEVANELVAKVVTGQWNAFFTDSAEKIVVAQSRLDSGVLAVLPVTAKNRSMRLTLKDPLKPAILRMDCEDGASPLLIYDATKLMDDSVIPVLAMVTVNAYGLVTLRGFGRVFYDKCVVEADPTRRFVLVSVDRRITLVLVSSSTTDDEVIPQGMIDVVRDVPCPEGRDQFLDTLLVDAVEGGRACAALTSGFGHVFMTPYQYNKFHGVGGHPSIGYSQFVDFCNKHTAPPRISVGRYFRSLRASMDAAIKLFEDCDTDMELFDILFIPFIGARMEVTKDVKGNSVIGVYLRRRYTDFIEDPYKNSNPLTILFDEYVMDVGPATAVSNVVPRNSTPYCVTLKARGDINGRKLRDHIRFINQRLCFFLEFDRGRQRLPTHFLQIVTSNMTVAAKKERVEQLVDSMQWKDYAHTLPEAQVVHCINDFFSRGAIDAEIIDGGGTSDGGDDDGDLPRLKISMGFKAKRTLLPTLLEDYKSRVAVIKNHVAPPGEDSGGNKGGAMDIEQRAI